MEGWDLGCGATRMQVVTFFVTDDCNNTTTCKAKVSIEDTTPPTITCPEEDLTLECSDDANEGLIATWLALATGADNCGSVDITNNYSPDGFSDEIQQKLLMRRLGGR